MIAAWLICPLVLGLLAFGCGLLLEAVARVRVPGALLLPAGTAVIVVAGGFTTMSDATAELTTPLVVGLAVAGGALGLQRRGLTLDRWPVAAAVAVFAVFAAPIVLSGQATFAGYIRLDDTATWMALTDRIMEHGRSLAGLPGSTYEATLAFNLASGYPIGVFVPLGIVHDLLGTDVAWLVQPYMAFMAAMLGLALWQLARPVEGTPWLRAAAAFVGAQSALLFGYYLWGGIKEVAAAALIATVGGLAGHCVRERFAAGTVVPLAVASAGLLGVLSAGGALWIAPLLAAAALLGARQIGLERIAGRAAGFLVLTAVLAIPVLTTGSLKPPTSSSLTDASAQGNLLHPLEATRLVGVWPAGDFRLDPVEPAAAYLLIAVVLAAALAGAYAAWRALAWETLLYVGGVLVAGLALFLVGSPWVGGKALATASAAIPFAAVMGVALLWGSGRRAEGAVVLAAIAGGVLWSNALAYRDVNLAPRDQLAELESIGHEIAGEGPTLMTEYNPYGARHFLRDAAPEGASELRRRNVFLNRGGVLKKGAYADTDEIQLDSLLVYRTLVLRRSPAASRPPSPYSLVERGEFYDVWQRARGETALLDHLSLGDKVDPAGVPKCSDVLHLAAEAGPGGRLAAVSRNPVSIMSLADTAHPREWNDPYYENALVPRTAGTLHARMSVVQPGDYEIWLGGSVRPQVDTTVDGKPAGSVRHILNNEEQYVRLGAARLAPGEHDVAVTFHGSDLHPGSGGAPDPIGPLVLSSQDSADTRVTYLDPAAAQELCGKPWDWIEALG